MTSVIVALPKEDDARNIKNLLVRNGFTVTSVCTTGAKVLSQVDDLNDGIIVCGYKLADMLFAQLKESLPEGFEILLLASQHLLVEGDVSGVMSLPMPLKVHDLINTLSMMIENMERKKRKRKLAPKTRKPEEMELIKEAKFLLMGRNNMTEEEAHRYIQKCSMDSGTNIVETAQMVLSLMKV